MWICQWNWKEKLCLHKNTKSWTGFNANDPFRYPAIDRQSTIDTKILIFSSFSRLMFPFTSPAWIRRLGLWPKLTKADYLWLWNCFSLHQNPPIITQKLTQIWKWDLHWPNVIFYCIFCCWNIHLYCVFLCWSLIWRWIHCSWTLIEGDLLVI